MTPGIVPEDREKGREPDDQDRPGKRGPKYKRAFGEPKDDAQESFTDPDSRIMKHSTVGYQQSYNAQAAVDAEQRLIIAAQVTQHVADSDELRPMIDAVESNTGELPTRVLADTGYKSEANLQMLEDRGVDGYVAVGRERKTARPIAADKVATQRMAKKLLTKRGRKLYAKRKHLGEPPFGWIKHVIGFRSFNLPGPTDGPRRVELDHPRHELASTQWKNGVGMTAGNLQSLPIGSSTRFNGLSSSFGPPPLVTAENSRLPQPEPVVAKASNLSALEPARALCRADS